MKHFFRALPVLLIVAFAQTTFAQTLFTYGTRSVSKDEFLKAYGKNNTTTERTEKALRDYLDLYIPFRLKVQAAYDAKLDTLPTQRAELQAFRNQLIQGFLTDPGSLSALVNEAFERSQQDISISHIFIPAHEDSVAQSAAAAKKAKEAYDQLKQGKNFGDVAIAYSQDPSVQKNFGDLGYITVFSLPYELETLAYNTPLNKFSEPYRSKAGYHIFKRTGERKAIGKVKVAQILIAFPPGATPADMEATRKKTDSIYQLVLKGADFAKLAADYSNDNFSYQQGGELPEFGTGRYDPTFEFAAFALSKNNSISTPVLTEYGYHIIKWLGAHPMSSDKAALMQELETQVQGDARIEVSKKVFQQNVLKVTGYKKGTFNTQALWAYTDSTIGNKPVPANTPISPATVLFSFTKQNITVKDWLAFRRSVGNVDRITSGKTHQNLLDYYVDLAALEYYRNHLEEFNKDFAFQLKEFKDGNLLFEVMQQKVWNKASTDSAGLRKYYNANKNKYWWENSASAILFTAMDDSIARDVQSKIKADPNTWRSLLEKYEGKVIADSGRFELSQLPASTAPFTPGIITPSLKNEADNSVSFAYIIKLFPNKEPRSFDDARGYIINDYQQHLENAWVGELRKKYPVKVNDAVFKSMIGK